MITEGKIDAARRAVQWLYYWKLLKDGGCEDIIGAEDRADRAIAYLSGEVKHAAYEVPPSFCDLCGKILPVPHIVNRSYHFCSEQCREEHKAVFGGYYEAASEN